MIDSIYTKEIVIETAIVESSGKQRTRLEKYYNDYDTDSLTRSLRKVQSSNIVGVVITTEENIPLVISRILELQQCSIKHIEDNIAESGESKRRTRMLEKYTAEYKITDRRTAS